MSKKDKIEKAIRNLMKRYGERDTGGSWFVRIDEDDIFEGDGGVSLETAVKEIENKLKV